MGTCISDSVEKRTKFSPQKNREKSKPSHKKWLALEFSLTSLPADHPLDVSSWSWELMLSQGLLKISVPFVLVKKDSDIEAQPSTVWSPTSCAKAVTSPTIMELEANPFTVTSLRMRTFNWGTLDPESCLWPTLDPTPTAHNFLFVPPKHHGLMENTLFSDKLSKEWMSSKRLNHTDLNQASVHKKLLLLTAANCKIRRSNKKLWKKRRNFVREVKRKTNKKISLYRKKYPHITTNLNCITEIMFLEWLFKLLQKKTWHFFKLSFIKIRFPLPLNISTKKNLPKLFHYKKTGL